MPKVVVVLRCGGIHVAQFNTLREASGLIDEWAEGRIRSPHLKFVDSTTGTVNFAVDTAQIVCLYLAQEGQ